MGYVYGSKCESRCLFPCRDLDRISDFLYRWVFCDEWVKKKNYSVKILSVVTFATH